MKTTKKSYIDPEFESDHTDPFEDDGAYAD